MVKIIKQELEFVECLKQRLEFICEFSKVTPTFINGSIRKLEKTNLTYIEPHRVIIKNIWKTYKCKYLEEQNRCSYKLHRLLVLPFCTVQSHGWNMIAVVKCDRCETVFVKVACCLRTFNNFECLDKRKIVFLNLGKNFAYARLEKSIITINMQADEISAFQNFKFALANFFSHIFITVPQIADATEFLKSKLSEIVQFTIYRDNWLDLFVPFFHLLIGDFRDWYFKHCDYLLKFSWRLETSKLFDLLVSKQYLHLYVIIFYIKFQLFLKNTWNDFENILIYIWAVSKKLSKPWVIFYI